jgi:hypothetical protein
MLQGELRKIKLLNIEIMKVADRTTVGQVELNDTILFWECDYDFSGGNTTRTDYTLTKEVTVINIRTLASGRKEFTYTTGSDTWKTGVRSPNTLLQEITEDLKKPQNK